MPFDALGRWMKTDHIVTDTIVFPYDQHNFFFTKNYKNKFCSFIGQPKTEGFKSSQGNV